MNHLVGVDVGGTFTDVLLMPLDGSHAVLAKVVTTPEPEDGVVAGVHEALVRAGLAADQVERVVHGTTIATNTVIQERGARVGLLVSRGFRYVLQIARSWTPGPVSGWMVWDKPDPLADLRDTIEITGRFGARGEIIDAIDEDEVRAAVRTLADRGVEALTVALVNGYVRPDVEAQVGDLARDEAPHLSVSLASHVLPEFREYERTLAAVANAYVQPAMARYVAGLEQSLAAELPGASLNVVRSDGGLMSVAGASERPIETVFSGPAGGVRGAVHVGSLVGMRKVLSFDMGGTSTDVALSTDGHAPVSRTSSLTSYYRVRVPSLDVVSIGAGGGSIAHVPRTGALRVGPESAGSSPGPACYGRGGTEPTVTDANVVLGHVPSLLAGRMDLHATRAAEAVQRIADALELAVEDAAQAIIDIANEKMLSALRLVSVQRGHDPRDFALVAFGGAGPLHGNALMELLGSAVCVVPPTPGVLSTFGFLVADVQREFARSHIRRLSELEDADVRVIMDELAKQGYGWLASEGFDEETRELSWQFGMRYYRQGYELPVVHDGPQDDPALLETLAARFVEAHRHAYQFDLEIEPELVIVRCLATGLTPTPITPRREPAGASPDAARVDAEHTIYWNAGWVSAPRYARERLEARNVLDGPCVIEQEDSTTLVKPGTRATVDRYLNLLLERA